jgi:hypothetical protein
MSGVYSAAMARFATSAYYFANGMTGLLSD